MNIAISHINRSSLRFSRRHRDPDSKQSLVLPCGHGEQIVLSGGHGGPVISALRRVNSVEFKASQDYTKKPYLGGRVVLRKLLGI